MFICLVAILTMAVARVIHGRVRRNHLLTLVTYAFVRLIFTRQAVMAIDILVSPSAASTQVVPNGGKGRKRKIKQHKKQEQ
jgi:hypothetical protein